MISAALSLMERSASFSGVSSESALESLCRSLTTMPPCVSSILMHYWVVKVNFSCGGQVRGLCFSALRESFSCFLARLKPCPFTKRFLAWLRHVVLRRLRMGCPRHGKSRIQLGCGVTRFLCLARSARQWRGTTMAPSTALRMLRKTQGPSTSVGMTANGFYLGRRVSSGGIT
jgi:hypothetical protein